MLPNQPIAEDFSSSLPTNQRVRMLEAMRQVMPELVKLERYRLALFADQVCVLRYDNEAGKGDHRHIGDVEEPYKFVDPTRLLADFWKNVEAWRG